MYGDVMPRSLLSSRDRTGAAALVVALHLAIALALLNLSGRPSLRESIESPPIEVFEITEALPPPPVMVEQLSPTPPPRRRSAAAPPNLRSEASPVVAPEPLVPLPLEPGLIATTERAMGINTTQGAASIAGPGTGAGGAGEGTGSGAGAGGGGGASGGSRPALVAGQFRFRHYPRDLREAWASAGPVLVTFQVQLNGRATGCRVYESSGNAEIDRETCRLAEARLRFRPAINEEGRAYVASYGYRQAPVR